MKVMLTGANGQVGSALRNSAPPDVGIIGMTRDGLDICDERAVSRFVETMKPELIINAAAYTAVDKAESEPALANAANRDGPGYLASAAARCGTRLIHISTDHVFDGKSVKPYRPDALTSPLNVYGHTKLAGESMVRRLLPDKSVVLRTAWIYSAHGHNFFQTMLRLMGLNGAVRVVCDQVGTPTSARFLSQAIWALANRPEVRGTFHWTSQGSASWYEFAVAIAEEAIAGGLLPPDIVVEPISTEAYPMPARRPAYSVLDSSALQTLLPVEPVDWRTQLRSIVRESRIA